MTTKGNGENMNIAEIRDKLLASIRYCIEMNCSCGGCDLLDNCVGFDLSDLCPYRSVPTADFDDLLATYIQTADEWKDVAAWLINMWQNEIRTYQRELAKECAKANHFFLVCQSLEKEADMYAEKLAQKVKGDKLI